VHAEGELDAVMVRRLKSDLRHFGERFPERVVEPILLDGLRDDAPELVLSGKLAEYGEITRARAANLPTRQAGNVRLAFVGLQQRLLSSIAAFARTLEVHRKGLVRTDLAGSDGAAEAFVHGGAETEDEPIEDDGEKCLFTQGKRTFAVHPVWRNSHGHGSRHHHGGIQQKRRLLRDHRYREAALSASARVLQTIVDSVPYAIYWKDADLIYRGCNQHFAADAETA
jgi:PAS domain-containing protein